MTRLLEGIKNIFKRVVNKLIPKKEISEIMDVDIVISNEMAIAIDNWIKIYENDAEWLDQEVGVFSLEIASAIASEFARQATSEMASEVVNNDFLNNQYQYVISNLREAIEYMCAFGGVAFKPYISNGEIVVDCVRADQFYPVEYNSRKKVTAAIFPEQIVKGKKTYTRIEYHRYSNNSHTIQSRAFVKDDSMLGSFSFSSLGREIPLTDVPEWAEIESMFVIENVDAPLFVYTKCPGANNIDRFSPLGMSIFKKAIPLIREADRQYGRFIWEFEGSELALDVSEDLLQTDEQGNPMLPSGKKRLFRSFGEGDGGSKSANLYEQFSPTIRDTSLINGFNNILKRIEFNVGLSYGTLSDPQSFEKTATEIKASKQRMYSTITDIQKSIEGGLDQLVYIMNVYAVALKKSNSIKVQTKHNWNDSVLIDTETEKLQDLQQVRDNLMMPWEYRMKWRGETAEQAKGILSNQGEKGITFGDE